MPMVVTGSEWPCKGKKPALDRVMEGLPVAVSVFDGRGHVISKTGRYSELIPDIVGDPALAVQQGWSVFAMDGSPMPRCKWPSVRILRGEAAEQRAYAKYCRKGSAEKVFLVSAVRHEGGGVGILHEITGQPIRLDAEVPLAVTDSVGSGTGSRPSTVGGPHSHTGTEDRSPSPKVQTNLSGRELDVLRLVAWGRSYAEISTQLGISAKTAETYRSRAMKRLALRTRSDVVRYAVEAGWFRGKDALPFPS